MRTLFSLPALPGTPTHPRSPHTSTTNYLNSFFLSLCLEEDVTAPIVFCLSYPHAAAPIHAVSTRKLLTAYNLKRSHLSVTEPEPQNRLTVGNKISPDAMTYVTACSYFCFALMCWKIDNYRTVIKSTVVYLNERDDEDRDESHRPDIDLQSIR